MGLEHVQEFINAGDNKIRRQLGQSRPGDTNAASLYSPASNIVAAIITTLVVCNQSGTADTFRVFLDDNGTTYDQTTALFYDIAIAADTTVTIELNLFMNDPTGNLAIRAATASALTFTAFGEEIQL